MNKILSIYKNSRDNNIKKVYKIKELRTQEKDT